VLRYEPPVRFIPWTTALVDIDIAGTTIPKGAPVWLMPAAANRDPKRFENPDRFDPDRTDNEHLGFYTGIHYCFGAPLARMEAQLALPELFRRVEDLQLREDPPPYRANAVLRGPLSGGTFRLHRAAVGPWGAVSWVPAPVSWQAHRSFGRCIACTRLRAVHQRHITVRGGRIGQGRHAALPGAGREERQRS